MNIIPTLRAGLNVRLLCQKTLNFAQNFSSRGSAPHPARATAPDPKWVLKFESTAPFGGVIVNLSSESASQPAPPFCSKVGVRAHPCERRSRWPCGRTSGCVSLSEHRRCDFSVVSTQKSIDTRHHSPPLRGGRASGRRGHGTRGAAAPKRGRKK